jgi:hypothetical protein
MRTALDMAKRLNQKSLRKIAAEVEILSHTQIPPPLSLREIMKLFAGVAKPEAPDHLTANTWIPDDTHAILGPYFGEVDWKDAGSGSVRYATNYHVRFSVIYDGDQLALVWDQWTTDKLYISPSGLNYSTDYKAAIMAWNEWGHSEWSWIKFSVPDDPNPSPSPGPGPGPSPGPTQPQYDAIAFYNCDNTPMSDPPHQPVYFWLRDVTANGAWQSWLVEPGYSDNTDQGCGIGISNPFIVPTSLKGGDTYQWVVVKPTDPECDGSNDPTGDCVVWGSTFTAGGNSPLVLQWPPV